MKIFDIALMYRAGYKKGYDKGKSEGGGGGSSSGLLSDIEGSPAEIKAEDLDGITSIRRYAFYFGTVKSVALPDSVKEIGSQAFSDNATLTNLDLGNGVTTINSSAFYKTGITSVIIPSSVRTIKSAAFSTCSALENVTIHEGVTNLESKVFYNDTALKSVNIPKTVTSLGTNLFGSCSNLTTITIDNGITALPANMFNACTELTNIVIPDSVTHIAENVFYKCSKLENVTLPSNATMIGNSAFYNCSALKSVTIPYGVPAIYIYTFKGCSALTSVTIPVTVTEIAKNVFDGCTSLTDIYYGGTEAEWNSITIDSTNIFDNVTIHFQPEPLEGTGSEYYTLAPTPMTFRSPEPLDEFQGVEINGETVDPSNYTLEEGSTIVTFPIEYMKTMPEGKHEVAIVSKNKTVSGNFTVTAPKLNEHGFYYNQPYVGYVPGWDKVIFFVRSDNTYDIMAVGKPVSTGEYTVDGNTITAIDPIYGTLTCTISADGNSIYCVQLQTNFVLTNDNLIAADDDYVYIYNEDLGGYEVKVIDKTKAEYGAIKTGINGIDTVTIGKYAFVNCHSLTSIVIPDSITSIGDEAFMNCHSLTSIVIPDSITSIGDEAFSTCTSLANIVFEGTVAQWNLIDLAENWAGQLNQAGFVLATYVQCTDGQVAI